MSSSACRGRGRHLAFHLMVRVSCSWFVLGEKFQSLFSKNWWGFGFFFFFSVGGSDCRDIVVVLPHPVCS